MADNLVEGVSLKSYAKNEATWDTVSAWAGTDAVAFDDLKLQPSLDAQPSKAHVGTASEQSMILGRRGGKFSASCDIRPNGAGVAPDVGPLLKAAFGAENIVGGTSVTYALSDTAAFSLQLANAIADAMYEVANGGWVEQLDIEIQGGSQPKFTFAGGYASHGWAYGTEVGVGGALMGASSVPYKTATKGNLGKGGVVQIGARTNGGAGYTITAVDDTTTPPTTTVSPVLEGAVSETDVIKPLLPAQTIGGTILGGVDCNLTVDGTAVGFISAKVSMKTGIHGRDKEATINRASGLARGKREVTGEIQFYFLDKTVGPYVGRAWAGATHALIMRIGENTAAKRCKINLPKVFVELTPVDIPEAEEAIWTMKFRALQNAAAADEFNVVFD